MCGTGKRWKRGGRTGRGGRQEEDVRIDPWKGSLSEREVEEEKKMINVKVII